MHDSTFHFWTVTAAHAASIIHVVQQRWLCTGWGFTHNAMFQLDTPKHTHTHKATTHCQWNLKWLAQISTKQGSDVSYVRHINVSSSSGCWRACTTTTTTTTPTPSLPPAVSFQSSRGGWSPLFFFPSGGRRATRLSITDLRVTGEDAAVSMEGGCVDAVSGGGGGGGPVK